MSEREVDRHVGADDPRDPLAGAAEPLAVRFAQAPGRALPLAAAVEQQEVGERDHDDRPDEVVEETEGDVLEAGGGVAELGGELRGLLAEQLGGLDGQRILVVGAGAMAGLAARTAAADGASVICANRTLSRAERLAEAVGGKAVALTELAQALAETDVLVTCTGARTLTIGVDDLAGTPVRGVVDLALPADVAPQVVEHGICLVNLDRLVTEQPDAASAQEIEDARVLVREEVADFLGLRRAAQVAPTVVALRSMASEVVASELRRLDARLPLLDDHEREQIQRSMRRIVDKLLHAPTVRVQELSAEPDAVDYAAALRELFALDPQTVAAVMSPEVGP